MKRFFVLSLALVISLGFCGCFLRQTPSDRTNPTTETSVSDENGEKVALSPAEAVSIYMSNIDMWQLDPDKFYMAGYYYLFLDLDFDGVLELITTEVQGSGRFSTNCYYKINLSDNSVEQIPLDESVSADGHCDFFFDDSPVLYKNKTTNEYQYVMCDYVRAGGGMDYYREDEYTYKDGKIYANPLFSFEVIQAEVSESGEKEEYYTIFSLGEGSEVDKETYDKTIKEYTDKFTDMELELETVNGGDFSEATEIEKSDMLLDAYKDFSYNGFEFED